jgi:hypothetical protein
MSLNACLVARYDKLGREAQQTTRSDVADGLTPIDHYDGQDEPPYRNPPVRFLAKCNVNPSVPGRTG